jgi:hypothetical protein
MGRGSGNKDRGSRKKLPWGGNPCIIFIFRLGPDRGGIYGLPVLKSLMKLDVSFPINPRPKDVAAGLEPDLA